MLNLVAQRESSDSKYIHGLTLNGEAVGRSWVRRRITAGGRWAFDVRDEPAPEDGFGRNPEDWPVSDWTLGDDASWRPPSAAAELLGRPFGRAGGEHR